jgi:shikimate kinase
MGTGKTSVGKSLAKKLGKQFVEMDELIEQRASKSINDIFAQDGEEHFRRLESELLGELSGKEDLVVSCGGGLICNENNLALLKDTGIVFNLESSPQVIYERTKKYTHRPLLNVDDPLGEIKELFLRRKPFYERAHHTVRSEDESPEEVADKIKEILENG